MQPNQFCTACLLLQGQDWQRDDFSSLPKRGFRTAVNLEVSSSKSSCFNLEPLGGSFWKQIWPWDSAGFFATTREAAITESPRWDSSFRGLVDINRQQKGARTARVVVDHTIPACRLHLWVLPSLCVWAGPVMCFYPVEYSKGDWMALPRLHYVM